KTAHKPLVPRATAPRPVPSRATRTHPHLIFNRELSWLDFNWRVLWQAIDGRFPMLERVRFLAITASNLDEFFRKRVGGLQRQEDAGVDALSPEGLRPDEQLRLIRQAVLPLQGRLGETWDRVLKPMLADEADIHIRDYADLNAKEQKYLDHYFTTHIFPILTPLAVDPGHPFPFISNLSLSLAVILRHPEEQSEHFARLKVPTATFRFVPLQGSKTFVPVEQVIINNLDDLFRGMEVVSAYTFRITRNADILRDEEEAEDLLAMISEELRLRRFSRVVRLEVDAEMPEHLRQILMRELDIDKDDLYESKALLDLTDLFEIANIGLREHSFKPWEPVVPHRLAMEGDKGPRSIFEVIREGDLLVHHPYESFSASTLRLMEEAAVDPDVLAIKQTLYRTSDRSPVMAALIRAAENGKQVAVLVEVKARFDEQNNIEWGQKLEKAGVHVTYGLVGLKTHTKVTLVVRQEEQGLRTYCHIGTGNYNPKTARLYTDLGLFTCDRAVGTDVVNLFHYLTGYAPAQEYKKLLVAPRFMRNTFVKAIDREIANQKKHGNGRIIAQMNALDDLVTIHALYKASQAGVQIDLIVRGHCRLRPGLPRYSENIRVVSILGRFLEHSRIYSFNNNGQPRIYFGSADWQRRNLEDRVEVIAEVEDAALKHRLMRTLELALEDERLAWDLHPDGRYVQRMPSAGDKERGYHDVLMKRALKRALDT
ncbi:MAG: polyphosphate kinase 1, partial [Bacteroidota bacterium]